MKKRILILWMCLCITAALVLICGTVLNLTSQKDQQIDVEELRDQLKKYQTITETEVPPEEIPVNSETDETVIPETEEIVISETEEIGISETEDYDASETAETIPEEIIVIEETETEPVVSETITPETETHKVLEASLDFESMWETNSDICAWIEIEGTKVDYPVLQSPYDDEKYLSTAADGSYYIGGSLFTQATYNSRDFNDPVTIIYGHTMKSGTLFGQLQPVYSSASGFDEHSEIKLYLPEEVRYYTVFAAVPYENIHILDTYDFSNDYWYRNFFKGVDKIRSFGANFNRDIIPEPGDRVLILSTCLNEDSTKRFLVMAIHQEDIAEQ